MKRVLSIGLLLVTGAIAGCKANNTGAACARSTDCAPGTGVCRAMTCTPTPCTPTIPCHGDEACVAGQCAPPTPAAAGRTLSAGGSVSSSGQHIHIGLTGQGRAVGSGGSPAHQHTTGATSVLRHE